MIASRYNSKHELKIMESVVCEIPERDRALITEVFCDSKATWCIRVSLREHNTELAERIGQTFDNEMMRLNRGHNGVSVVAGEDCLCLIRGHLEA
jgi:hypothetical protein